jgi:propane monooxygenase reductase component
VCGPPPMIDASIPMLGAHALLEARIFYDKFTVTASEDEPGAPSDLEEVT